ncbi:MAG: serine/threonine protein kinase [Planctomycetota bacterium]|nr:MAG: serine/threonine protein kinase [Planctomycetota bacterium]
MVDAGGRKTHGERSSTGELTPPQPRPGLAKTGSFGRILLDRGLITPEQLERALEVQRTRARKGDFARLGHILVELGLLTNDQVQTALQAQKITILICSACGSQYNIRGFAPGSGKTYECPKCHAELVTADKLEDVTVQDHLEVRADPTLDLEGEDTVKLARPEDSNTAKIRQLRRLGKYEILGEIARGGMGIIYKARQLDLDRIVALKTLRQDELDKPDAADRFHDEARAVASLRHPNIVAVHEVGQHDGILYFTMEFIEGLPLDKQLHREGLRPRQAVEVVLAIAQALEYAHRQGVVHRDLKPANIIVDLEGVPFLVDFGIARRLDVGPRLEYDEEEDLLGSIPYMAPEYVEGKAYDELCDLYSLGVLLYEALAGSNKLPYYDDDTRRFLEKIVLEPPAPITTHCPDLDPGLVGIVHRMIARRAERYQSMAACVRDMQRWLVTQDEAPTGAGAPPPQPSPLLAPPPRRGRGLTATLAVATLLLGPAALWQTHRVSTLRSRLDDQRTRMVQLSQRRAEELALAHLQHARRLVELGRSAEAQEACTLAINQVRDDAPPSLAALYRLRGSIRRSLGDERGERDLRRAAQLDGSPQ